MLGPLKCWVQKNAVYNKFLGPNKWVNTKWSYCTLLIWITLYTVTIGHPVSCDYGLPFSLSVASRPNTTRAVWWVGGWLGGCRKINKPLRDPILQAEYCHDFKLGWNFQIGPSVAKRTAELSSCCTVICSIILIDHWCFSQSLQGTGHRFPN